jgi:hypothetical protein
MDVFKGYPETSKQAPEPAATPKAAAPVANNFANMPASARRRKYPTFHSRTLLYALEFLRPRSEHLWGNWRAVGLIHRMTPDHPAPGMISRIFLLRVKGVTEPHTFSSTQQRNATRYAKWKFSEVKVQQIFQDEPGMLKLCHPSRLVGRKLQRGYFTLRIPESVFLRVQNRLMQKRDSESIGLPIARRGRRRLRDSIGGCTVCTSRISRWILKCVCGHRSFRKLLRE